MDHRSQDAWFALLMVMAAVVVGYCASRVGASIGRDLRDKTFRNVVQYSNAEMDHFQRHP